MNPLIFIFAGALVLTGIVGIIVVSLGNAKKTKVAAQKQELTRIQDSVRASNRARRDTVKVAVRNEAAKALTGEIDKLDQRFNVVRQQVVKGQPGPEQTKLINQISYEVARLRQLAGTVVDQPEPRSDSIKTRIRDSERVVRNLISDLSRAPKK